MATKKAANGTNGTSSGGGHVSLAREEYLAFQAREESYQQLVVDHERTKATNRDLADTLDAQGRQLSMRDLTITHLERLAALQQMFLDKVRSGTEIATLEDLTEFWRRWLLAVRKGTDEKKFSHGEVEKYEPDLFRSWRNWVNDASKADRTFNEAGSRAERDASIPGTAKEMQEHIIVRMRQDNAKLANRVLQLEAEMEAFKNEKKTNEKNTNQQESRP